MRACAFFGSSDVTADIVPKLEGVISDLIKNYDVDVFCVGDRGGFDKAVKKALWTVSAKHPHIEYYVVLAYMPLGRAQDSLKEQAKTLFPQALEYAPPRFAIDKRNRWMVEAADVVVTYIGKGITRALRYKKLAECKGKKLVEL